MFIVFTDLDGTLLDRETYSWEPARGVIERLIAVGIPWLFVTSKTRAETEVWRARTGNRHPFIVENGAAAVIEAGYFAHRTPGAIVQAGCEILEWGTRYATLVSGLKEASEASGCRVRGFHDMAVEEVAEATALALDDAALAKQREYDEPFVVLDPKRAGRLVAAIEARGMHCTRGGRFWHITGANDKGAAVHAVTALYERAGEVTESIGLGDGLNDAPMLQQVAIPVVVRSAHAVALHELAPRAMVTAQEGPAGWAEALRRLIPALHK